MRNLIFLKDHDEFTISPNHLKSLIFVCQYYFSQNKLNQLIPTGITHTTFRQNS